MARQWFYRSGNGDVGPVTFQQLVALVRAGTLCHSDPVRNEWPFDDWVRADSVPGLFYMAGRSAAAVEEDPGNRQTATPQQRAGTSAQGRADVCDVSGDPPHTCLEHAAQRPFPSDVDASPPGTAALDSRWRELVEAALRVVRRHDGRDRGGGNAEAGAQRQVRGGWALLLRAALLRYSGGIATLRLPTVATAKRPTFRRVLFVAAVVIGAIWLRASPVFEATVPQQRDRLVGLWERIQDARDRSGQAATWVKVSEQALAETEEISEALASAHNRGLEPSLVTLIFGRDETADAALCDLYQVARYDLPAVVRAGRAGTLQREREMTARLARVSDHVASRASFTASLHGRAAAAPEGGWTFFVTAAVLLADAAVVTAAVVAWRRRAIRRRLTHG